MAITITHSGSFFNKEQNATIIFKDVNESSSFSTKRVEDFILIFNNDSNKVVGINVIDFRKYFNLEDGFHVVSDELKKVLMVKFSNYLVEDDFEPFYIVGQILQLSNHPKNERLKVMKVNFGNEEKQIITNLSSVKENEKYLFATSGSIIYSGTRIVDSKMMDVLSQGMIMTYKSLGIDKEGLVDCTNLEIGQEYKF